MSVEIRTVGNHIDQIGLSLPEGRIWRRYGRRYDRVIRAMTWYLYNYFYMCTRFSKNTYLRSTIVSGDDLFYHFYGRRIENYLKLLKNFDVPDFCSVCYAIPPIGNHRPLSA